MGLRGTLFHTLFFSFLNTRTPFSPFLLTRLLFLFSFFPFLQQGKCRLPPTTRNYWRFPTDSPTRLLPSSSLFKIEIVLPLERVFFLSLRASGGDSQYWIPRSAMTHYGKKEMGEKGGNTRTHTHTDTNLNTTHGPIGGEMHVYTTSNTRLEGENAIKYSLLLSLFTCSLSLHRSFLRHLYTKVSLCIGVLSLSTVSFLIYHVHRRPR